MPNGTVVDTTATISTATTSTATTSTATIPAATIPAITIPAANGSANTPVNATAMPIANLGVNPNNINPSTNPSANSSVNPTGVNPTGVNPMANPTSAVTPIRNVALGLENQSSAENVQQLINRFRSYGLPEARAQRLADSYAQYGLTSVDDAINLLYQDSARAIALSEVDILAAQQQIGTVEENYRRFLDSLLSTNHSSFNDQSVNMLRKMRQNPLLSSQDVALLAGQVASAENLLKQGQVDGRFSINRNAQALWQGMLRMLVLLLLALLAFVPLYLLGLAFGSGNRNWQWVRLSLFLLLLPVIYEGLAALLSYIGGFMALPILNILSRYSFFQSSLGHLAWAMLMLTAIIAASIGLWGICKQFGLLGNAKQDDVNKERLTISDSRASMTRSDLGQETVIEWEDEF
ncbi:MAG: hypothetical protein R2880_10360 [Deinococcales bacterium]